MSHGDSDLGDHTGSEEADTIADLNAEVRMLRARLADERARYDDLRSAYEQLKAIACEAIVNNDDVNTRLADSYAENSRLQARLKDLEALQADAKNESIPDWRTFFAPDDATPPSRDASAGSTRQASSFTSDRPRASPASTRARPQSVGNFRHLVQFIFEDDPNRACDAVERSSFVPNPPQFLSLWRSSLRMWATMVRTMDVAMAFELGWHLYYCNRAMSGRLLHPEMPWNEVEADLFGDILSQPPETLPSVDEAKADKPTKPPCPSSTKPHQKSPQSTNNRQDQAESAVRCDDRAVFLNHRGLDDSPKWDSHVAIGTWPDRNRRSAASSEPDSESSEYTQWEDSSTDVQSAPRGARGAPASYGPRGRGCRGRAKYMCAANAFDAPTRSQHVPHKSTYKKQPMSHQGGHAKHNAGQPKRPYTQRADPPAGEVHSPDVVEWLRWETIADDSVYAEINSGTSSDGDLTTPPTQGTIATEEEIRQLPLTETFMEPLDMQVVLGRMNDVTHARFKEVWRLIGVPPPLPLVRPGCTLHPKDAAQLMTAGILERADSRQTRGWFSPLTVVEENYRGLRRRFIASPEAKNASDVYVPDLVEPDMVSHLDTVPGASAAVFNLPRSPFQFELPYKWRRLYRCVTSDGAVLQLTRLPNGYRACPEIVHTVSRVLGGDPRAVSSFVEVPKQLSIAVWINRVVFAGPPEVVSSWYHTTLTTLHDARATILSKKDDAPRFTFAGVCFDYEASTVCLSEKLVNQLRERPPLAFMTIADLSHHVSKLLKASCVLQVRPLIYYEALRRARQLFVDRSRWTVNGSSPAYLTTEVIQLFSEWENKLIQNTPASLVRPPASPFIRIEVTLSKWSAFLSLSTGELLSAGADTSSTIRTVCEMRAVHKCLAAFAPRLHGRVIVQIDHGGMPYRKPMADVASSVAHQLMESILELVQRLGLQVKIAYGPTASKKKETIGQAWEQPNEDTADRIVVRGIGIELGD